MGGGGGGGEKEEGRRVNSNVYFKMSIRSAFYSGQVEQHCTEPTQALCLYIQGTSTLP